MGENIPDHTASKNKCATWKSRFEGEKKKKVVTSKMNEPDEKQNSVEEVTGLPDSIAQQ